MEEITNNVKLSAFALKLRRLRLEKGLSIKELSLSCGISVKRLFLYENDNRVPSLGEINKLERFYGLESGELLKIEGNNP